MEKIDAEWIRARLLGYHGELGELADWVGISRQKMSKIMSGERRIQAAEVPDILSFFEGRDESNRKIEELPFRLRPLPVPDFEGAEAPRLTDNERAAIERELDRALVDVFAVEASAGNGSAVAEHEEITAQLAFPRDYLRRITTCHPRHLRIISVKGDSMAPTLQDDDIVMLDSSKTDLSWDGLFVLRYADALHVKRVSRSTTRGYVRIISDNRLYEALDLPANDVVAVGKVIWSGGKIG
ncbi:S24 family peptidase [Loktanella atrilutea]|nr:S24 family peptidase [Loktanella atrilutea]